MSPYKIIDAKEKTCCDGVRKRRAAMVRKRIFTKYSKTDLGQYAREKSASHIYYKKAGNGI